MVRGTGFYIKVQRFWMRSENMKIPCFSNSHGMSLVPLGYACHPPHIYVEILITNVMELEGETFWSSLGHDSGALVSVINAPCTSYYVRI